MSVVFLDTVGMLAQWDRSDEWHDAAARAFGELVARGDRTVSTTFVFLECGNAAARRPYRALVAQTRAELEASGRLIVPSQEEWEAAWSAYGRGVAGDAGIVDHVSFMVMRRLGISDVFSNDQHFKAAGFNTLF
jgi:predicted nucleic acid-binding protein